MNHKHKPASIRAAVTREAQLDRFKQTARELGCDETGEAFEKAFAKAAPAKKPDKLKES